MTNLIDTQVLTARSPEDVLAAVPIVLGFVPERSLVMLTFNAEHPFQARVDLPTSSSERRECADQLLEPVVRHGASGVLFVFYTDDAAQAASCARVLVPRFERAGVDVVSVLRSDDTSWFAVPLRPSAVEPIGTPYDVSGHVFTARAVASGRVTHSSRGELAATVAADRSATRAVQKARTRLGEQPPEEARWLLSTVDALVAERARADPPTAARLLVALCEPDVRDALLGSLDRRSAERLVPVLSALVRSAPADLLAPVASVLGFAAWLAGDGALAWCALDRAGEGDPPCSLAKPVAEALERAVPPTVWESR